MIKNFQLLIHQVLDSVELNEKTFRDHEESSSRFIVWSVFDVLQFKELK